MTKTQKKTYAEEGLEDLSTELGAAEEAVGTNTEVGEDEFVSVGNFDPIDFYFRTSAPKKASKHPFKIIEKGQSIIGVYERSFIAGKYNNPTYVLLLDDGKRAGLPGTGGLNKKLEKLQEGSRVKITYEGMTPVKSGKWEGNDAHAFTVFASKGSIKQA